MGKLDDFIKSNPSIGDSQLLSSEELMLLEGGACSDGCRPACANQCKPGCSPDNKSTITSGTVEAIGSAAQNIACSLTKKG